MGEDLFKATEDPKELRRYLLKHPSIDLKVVEKAVYKRVGLDPKMEWDLVDEVKQFSGWKKGKKTEDKHPSNESDWEKVSSTIYKYQDPYVTFIIEFVLEDEKAQYEIWKLNMKLPGQDWKEVDEHEDVGGAVEHLRGTASIIYDTEVRSDEACGRKTPVEEAIKAIGISPEKFRIRTGAEFVPPEKQEWIVFKRDYPELSFDLLASGGATFMLQFDEKDNSKWKMTGTKPSGSSENFLGEYPTFRVAIGAIQTYLTK